MILISDNIERRKICLYFWDQKVYVRICHNDKKNASMLKELYIFFYNHFMPSKAVIPVVYGGGGATGNERERED